MPQGDDLVARKLDHQSNSKNLSSLKGPSGVCITEQYVIRTTPLTVPGNTDDFESGVPGAGYFQARTSVPRPKAPKHRGPTEVSSAQTRSNPMQTPEITQRVLESLYDNKVKEESKNNRVQEMREMDRCRMKKRIQDRQKLESICKGMSSPSPSATSGLTEASQSQRDMMREADEVNLLVNAERNHVLSEHRALCLSSLRHSHHARDKLERSLQTHYSQVKNRIRCEAGLTDDDFPLDAPMEMSLCPSKSEVFRAMRNQHEREYLKKEEDADIERAMTELSVRDNALRKDRKNVEKVNKSMNKRTERKRDVPYDVPPTASSLSSNRPPAC